MEKIPPASGTYNIETDWGIVRVYEWKGHKNWEKTPVLLLPGHSSGVPMWEVNIPYFIGNRPVYALDPIGDAGLSVQSVPLKDMDDSSEWLSQTIKGLGIEKVHIVGHSFGGGNAANFTLGHPEQVQTLTL
ncbi:MAG: alpha/beta fold hydrolase [Tissierellia bacterium]|nr:alpha/beta fold hydrolase [Tissierellia bacterium]